MSGLSSFISKRATELSDSFLLFHCETGFRFQCAQYFIDMGSSWFFLVPILSYSSDSTVKEQCLKRRRREEEEVEQLFMWSKRKCWWVAVPTILL